MPPPPWPVWAPCARFQGDGAVLLGLLQRLLPQLGPGDPQAASLPRTQAARPNARRPPPDRGGTMGLQNGTVVNGNGKRRRDMRFSNINKRQRLRVVVF